MTKLDATQWVAIVATIALLFNIGKVCFERRRKRRERSKIHVRFGITIIKRNVPHFGDMHIFPLCITNFGRDDVTIAAVEMRLKNGKCQPGAYNEPEAALGIYGERMLPKRLGFGDTLTLEQFTLAAFSDCPDEVVVFDAEGNEYKVPQDKLKDEFQEAQRIVEHINETRQAGVRAAA